ncbi:MAG: gliding motility-associated C-terminal domain-containing protein [Flavobacteriales bacterium]
MKIMFRVFSLLFLALSFFGAQETYATHLTGGVITYTNTGGSNYTVQVTLYRDCSSSSNAGFAANATLEVFNGTTFTQISTFNAGHGGESEVDIQIDDPCIELPANLCIKKVVHTFNITLPSSAALQGYVLNYRRCCFSNSIQNIVNPDDDGLNISTTIPAIGGGNPAGFNSPVFNEDPAVTLCLYDELNEDFGASLPTPDPTITLLHSFYTPHSGGFSSSTTIPFDDVTYVSPYTFDNPVEANPVLQIDPFTGIVTGTITELGFFLIGVQVHYVKGGDTIGYIQRPFRYLVSDCNINRSISDFGSPVECGDLEVEFANGSFGADSYTWNFDDPASGADNETDVETPTHTFSDYGTYDVMLITTAGNDVACSDTSFLEVVLENGATSEIAVNKQSQCLAANNFNFTVTSSKPNVSYLWEFGPNANVPTSTLPSPTGIIYNSTGTYTVTLTTTYQECSSETTYEVTVYDGLLSHFTGPTEGCAPFEAVFEPTVNNADYTYVWTINGEQIIGNTATYLFTQENEYDIKLYVYDVDGCESTVEEIDYIHIFEEPEVGFNISEQFISAGDIIIIENEIVNPNYIISFDIPEVTDTPIVTQGQFAQVFYEEGEFEIVQTVVNGECVSYKTITVHVGPPNVEPPNVFTPNNDLNNDVFYFDPFYNRNVILRIYDRWGNIVFESTNYELCNSEASEFCWNGLNKNGDECSPGVYSYTVLLQNGNKQEGTITLFK